ncbi:MAG: 30S ribosomal protein S7 [Brevinematales bacterium]
MPRRKKTTLVRSIAPDPKYKSVLVAKFINRVMRDGKKAIAQKIVYGAMDYLAEKTKLPALEAFEKALENIKPPLEVRSRRVGGATYQVPVEVRPERQIALTFRWLVTLSQKRKGHSMAEKLGGELFDAYNNTGSCVKKKEDTIKMAEANRAFAHYRW